MPQSTAPVDRLQPRLGFLQSVDQAVDRFPVTVDRAVDRSVSVYLVHTGRPGGRPDPCIGRPDGQLC